MASTSDQLDMHDATLYFTQNGELLIDWGKKGMPNDEDSGCSDLPKP